MRKRSWNQATFSGRRCFRKENFPWPQATKISAFYSSEPRSIIGRPVAGVLPFHSFARNGLDAPVGVSGIHGLDVFASRMPAVSLRDVCYAHAFRGGQVGDDRLD